MTSRGGERRDQPEAGGPCAAGPRIAVLVTDVVSALTLLRGQLAFLRESGFDVHLICNAGEGGGEVARREGVKVWNVPFAREISVWRDLQCAVLTVKALAAIGPDLVSAGTPKASLLGLAAARWLRIPSRVYVLRGLRSECETGVRRVVLELAEALTAANATEILCVSESLRRRYRDRGLAGGIPCTVLGPGSSNGVDFARFAAWEGDRERRQELRLEPGAVVIGFVGRLCAAKGVSGLLRAFEDVADRHPDVSLLLVGPVEEPEMGSSLQQAEVRWPGRVRVTGMVTDTAPYYGSMDILVLPTSREGFPNVPLEAAAAGVPTVAYRVTGTEDAVADGKTGLLVKAGDVGALSGALERYLEAPDLRRSHGAAARARAETHFGRETIWRLLVNHYFGLLGLKASADTKL